MAINFQLSLIIYTLVAIPFCLILIGYAFIFLLYVFGFIFVIMAAISADRGDYYRYPLTIRFL